MDYMNSVNHENINKLVMIEEIKIKPNTVINDFLLANKILEYVQRTKKNQFLSL